MMTTTNEYLFKRRAHNSAAFPIKWMATIQFGMASRNCKNYGICKISSVHEDIDIHDKQSKMPAALASVHIESSTLVRFFFLKQTMTPHTINTYFNSTHFRIGEDVVFSPNLGKTQVFIKKGNYPICIRPWGYEVCFKS